MDRNVSFWFIAGVREGLTPGLRLRLFLLSMTLIFFHFVVSFPFLSQLLLLQEQLRIPSGINRK